MQKFTNQQKCIKKEQGKMEKEKNSKYANHC